MDSFRLYALILFTVKFIQCEEVTIVTVPISIGQFENFACLPVIEHTVPTEARSLHWFFNASASGHDQCRQANVTMHIQHGSFPLFNVTKETFPRDGYMLRRTNLQKLTIKPNGSVNILTIYNPLPGRWFASAYVHTETNDVIKVLTTNICSYTLSVNSSTSTNPNRLFTDVVPYHSTEAVITKEETYRVFRFRSTEETWKHEVKIVDCRVGDNQSSSCPIWLLLTSSVPFNNQSAGTEHNCTESPLPCVVSLDAPVIDDWQYVYIQTLANATVEFTMYLNVFELEDLVQQKRKCNAMTESLAKRSSESISIIDAGQAILSQSSASHAFLTNQPASHTANVEEDREAMSATQQTEVFEPEDSELASLTTGDNEFYSWEVTHAPVPTTSNSDVAPVDSTRTVALGPGKMPIDNSSEGLSVHFLRYNRYESAGYEFSTSFFLWDSGSLQVSDNKLYILRWDILSPRDIGGDMVVTIQLNSQTVNTDVEHVRILVCMQQLRHPVNETGLHCQPTGGHWIKLDSGAQHYVQTVVVPYPEAGPWLLGITAQCYNSNGTSGEAVSCSRKEGYSVLPHVHLEPVSGCRNAGYSTSLQSGGYLVSFCQCRAGYQGYVCTDSTHAPSHSQQLLNTYLLTLSNLLFLPGIVVALRRRYFSEALIYAANMFFSAFYHACDMGPWSKFMLCIAPYHVLQYSDFFCSIMSFWVTLVALAALPPALTSVLHMTGAVALAMAVEWQTIGLLTNVVPFSVGCAVIIVSWIVRCVRSRACFPPRRQWLCILPGMLLAGGGLSMFLLIETDANYPYTHSVWHVCMALSIVCLLPPRRNSTKDPDSASRDSDTSFELNGGGLGAFHAYDDDALLVLNEEDAEPSTFNRLLQL